jgi:hypothetical protein
MRINGLIFGVLLLSLLRRLTGNCKVPAMLTRFTSGFGNQVLEEGIIFFGWLLFCDRLNT